GPSERFEYVTGLVHAAKAPPSRRHWNEPASVALNAKVALDELVAPAGPDVIVVSGATVSTLQVRDAGVESMLPAASIARTSKVCVPCAKPDRFAGLVHAAKAAPSSRHSKVPDSVDENQIVAVVDATVPVGPAVIVVSGATLSRVKTRCVGVGATLFKASNART